MSQKKKKIIILIWPLNGGTREEKNYCFINIMYKYVIALHI